MAGFGRVGRGKKEGLEKTQAGGRELPFPGHASGEESSIKGSGFFFLFFLATPGAACGTLVPRLGIETASRL